MSGLFFMRLLIVLAVLPGLLLAVWIYKLDRIEKEPKWLLIKLALFGALTTVPAMFLEMGLSTLEGMVLTQDTIPYMIVDNFLVVACVEEAGKYIVTKKLTWKSPEFNYRFDAIVYTTAASLGFAIAENVAYVIEYGLSTALVRAVTAIPAHTIFGIAMGHYYGLAKEYANLGNRKKSRRYLFLAYFFPVFAHGMYDLFAGSSSVIACIIFLIVVILQDVFAYRRIRRDSAGDRHI